MTMRICAVPWAVSCEQPGFFRSAIPSAEAFLPDTERPYFDYLVLDLRLGGMSGIELRQRLNEMGSNIPVIFNTAHADPVDQERAAQVGCPA